MLKAVSNMVAEGSSVDGHLRAYGLTTRCDAYPNTAYYGARCAFDVLGDASREEDLGQAFGHDLTAREIEWFVREEWATSADDVLWRRTKCGLPMTPVEAAAVRAHLHAQYALA